MSRVVWAVGEVDDGRLVSSSIGVATLARELAGAEAVGVVVATDGRAAAEQLAAFVPNLIAAQAPVGHFLTPSTIAPFIAELVRERHPAYLLIPGTPGGRELAGALSALLQWGVLANATSAEWQDGLVVNSVVFRTDLNVRSGFTADHGIVTVQPHAVSPSPAATTGVIETLVASDESIACRVRRTELVTDAVPTPVEGARVVVAGGAGVGSREAWSVVESLANALDGAVGASRPAVDKGWVPYSQQIGQTGKTVRPDLYVALGISGEVQHRVGMRMSKTVIAIDTDPEAPFARHADLFVNADLIDIVPPLVDRIKAARREGGQP